MSVTSIPDHVKFALWGVAAGRCQYCGCNRPLWKDDLTQWEFNSAYLAHIIADRPNGPRGDPFLSSLLATDISNLMLLCDAHHRLIDKADVAGHPAELLRQMKEDHERRIELQAGIAPDMRSDILCYGSGICDHPAPVDFRMCSEALRPVRYPASARGIGLGVKESAVRDRDSLYWQFHEAHLRQQFAARVAPRLADGTVEHLSLFAIAPQPLLILLGTLLADITVPVDTYQRRREPITWAWPDKPEIAPFIVEKPTRRSQTNALVFSLSASVNDSRITEVLGDDTSIWRVRFNRPHHDAIQDRNQLRDFRRICRQLLDEIKANVGQKGTLHVFPALPVSASVEFGRVIQPKADMAIIVYDEQQPHGFVRSLNLQRAVFPALQPA